MVGLDSCVDATAALGCGNLEPRLGGRLGMGSHGFRSRLDLVEPARVSTTQKL